MAPGPRHPSEPPPLPARLPETRPDDPFFAIDGPIRLNAGGSACFALGAGLLATGGAPVVSGAILFAASTRRGPVRRTA